MKIEFNKYDNLYIAERIVRNITEDDIQVEMNGILFNVRYDIEQYGYYEDGYDNGTGAFICTEAHVIILSIEADELDVEVDYDNDVIVNAVQDNLIHHCL